MRPLSAYFKLKRHATYRHSSLRRPLGPLGKGMDFTLVMTLRKQRWMDREVPLDPFLFLPGGFKIRRLMGHVMKGTYRNSRYQKARMKNWDSRNA